VTRSNVVRETDSLNMTVGVRAVMLPMLGMGWQAAVRVTVSRGGTCSRLCTGQVWAMKKLRMQIRRRKEALRAFQGRSEQHGKWTIRTAVTVFSRGGRVQVVIRTILQAPANTTMLTAAAEGSFQPVQESCLDSGMTRSACGHRGLMGRRSLKQGVPTSCAHRFSS